MDVNNYLTQLGQFGVYQLYVYVLTTLPALVAGMAALQNVFLLGEPRHRCFVEECDSIDSKIVENWTNFTIPKGISCAKYILPANSSNLCFDAVTDTSRTISCSKFVYARDEFVQTAVSEWNLVCGAHWISSLSTSVFMLGNLFGSLSYGIIADKFGRRSVYYWGPVLYAAAALLVAFSPNIYVFTLANFFIAINGTGLYMIGFILGVEFIGPKYRVWCANGYQIVFAFGEIFLAGIAFHVRSWRQLEGILSIFMGSLFLLAFFLPESVRWLVSKDREDEAMKTIERAARWNKIALEQSETDLRTKSPDPTEESSISPEKSPEKPGLVTIMKNPLLRRWSLNLYFTWAVNALVYYGLSISASALGEGMSVYYTFMLLAVVEIPFVVAMSAAMNKWGRRWPLAASMTMSGIFCLSSAFFQGHSVVNVALGVLGKGCIASSFALVYFYTAEIYPTVLRSAGLGLCSTMARIGGLMAPFVVDMAFFGKATPLIICGVMSLVAGLLSLDLPETHNKKLPETIDDLNSLRKSGSNSKDMS